LYFTLRPTGPTARPSRPASPAERRPRLEGMAAVSWSGNRQVVWTGLDAVPLSTSSLRSFGGPRGGHAVVSRWAGGPAVAMDAQAGAQPGPAPHRLGRGGFIPRRLCAHWARSGWCRKGDACTFAHGPHELHPDAQMALMQVSPGQMTVNMPQYTDVIPSAGAEHAGADLALAEADVGSEAKPSEFKFNANAPVFVVNTNASDLMRSMAAAEGNCDPTLDANAAQYTMVPTPGLAPSGAVPPLEPEGTGASSRMEASAGMIASPSAGEERRKPAEESAAVADRAEEAVEPNGETPAKPQVRRKVPSPLTGVEAADALAASATVAPQSPVPFQGSLPSASPAAAAARRFLTRIGAAAPGSPAQVVFAAQVATPKAVSIAAGQLASPRAAPRSQPLTSPSGAVPLSPMHLAADPATPGATQRTPLVASPLALGSPQPISRGTLLQARGVAQKIHQGPPGLAMYAPTPTSAARSFGFAYPQPGFFRTEAKPTKVMTVRHQHQ